MHSFLPFSCQSIPIDPHSRLTNPTSTGIGAGITAALLQRPNTTVIATSRKPLSTTEPPAPPASGSKFISFLLDEENPEITSATLAARLEKETGITKLNVVIANAGDSAGFSDVAGTNPDDMLYDFRVNSVGPAKLFRACWPLLDHDSGEVGQEKKFAVVSSSIGSIGLQFLDNLPGLAYGMSKAALNYFAVSAAVQFKEKGLLVGVIHPG